MKRYDLVDTLRGFSVISMILFHACWIMSYFGMAVSQEQIYGTGFTIWERTICIGFILIAGFSFSYGHNHLKNALKIFAAGLAITVITCIAVPDIRIVFGILTFIGTASLIMIPLDRLIQKTAGRNAAFSITLFVLCMLIFLFTYNINKGFLGLTVRSSIDLPKELYSGLAATFFGFTDPSFRSADYFSLIPWIFMYLSGYFLQKVMRLFGIEDKYLTKGVPVLSSVGRHSLIIYIIHPVILFALIFCISIFMK
ncbi:MAG: DUF1624 domain-containing protein [Lachnospiraceae bacterium]|nr:DUF1624 domain-containing protein [Lachnospiraceae bacterium]